MPVASFGTAETTLTAASLFAVEACAYSGVPRSVFSLISIVMVLETSMIENPE